MNIKFFFIKRNFILPLMSQALQEHSILFVNSHSPESYGGGERWYLLMAEWFESQGYRIYLLCRPQSKLIPQFERLNAAIFPFKFSFDFNPISAYRVYRIIKSHRIQFLICNFNKDVSIAGMAGRFAKVDKILFINGFELIEKKWKHKWLLPFFDIIISNTNYLKEKYKSYQWGLEYKTVVIYNGIKFPNLNEHLKKHDKLVIFGAGRLTDIKRYHLFLDLIKRLVQDDIKIQGIIAGNGDEYNSLKNRIESENLPITLLGHIADINPYLEISDIFLHTSSHEGMPTVIIEAMSHKLPVVTTNAGGTSEIVKHLENGMIHEVSDFENLFGSLKKLVIDKDLRMKLGQFAYKTYQDKFDFEKSLTAIESLLLK